MKGLFLYFAYFVVFFCFAAALFDVVVDQPIAALIEVLLGCTNIITIVYAS